MHELVMQLDGEQLLADLDEFDQFGKRPGGGVHRLAYSDADLDGRRWVAEQMAALGLGPELDAAGNVLGRLPGLEHLPAIALGSHTDSVPDGGKFDGSLGVFGALACVRTLAAAGVRLRHPLLIIDFAAEEATTSASPTGSMAFIGQLKTPMLEQPAWNGQPTAHLMLEAGFEPSHAVSLHPPAVAAFLELHVEQGDLLETHGVEIGVVEGIVGIRRYLITITGEANHAGTTQMNRRRDALVAAAPLITHVRALAETYGVVGTVGRIQVERNAPNVIPGWVELDVEFRSVNEARLEIVESELLAAAHAAGGSVDPGAIQHPVHADPQIQVTIEQTCRELGYTTMRLPAAAGHDAMNMALICPFGMIFVPSVNGISHAPGEFTEPEDCINGARILLATLLELDKQL